MNIKLKKNLGYVAVFSGLSAVILPSNVYAAKNHEGVCEVETKNGEFSFNASGKERTTKKPMDLIQIIDLSGSLSDSEYKQRNGVSGARRQQINDMIYTIRTQLTDQDHVMLAFYGTNSVNSYVIDGQDGGIATRLLTKTEAINILTKINNEEQVHTLSQAWTLIPQVVKPMLDGYLADSPSGTGFEDVYMSQPNRNKVVSVLQFTDDWVGSEDIDSSFAAWAKKNAKTFMTVVDNAQSDSSTSTENMKAVGHPNIKVFRRLDEPNRQETIANLFKSTAIEKEQPKVTINVTPEQGLTLKEVKLVSPDGKEENLAISNNRVNIEKDLPKDGNWTVKIKADGLVPETRKVIATATIGGKEVGKKELVFEGCENSVVGTDEEKKVEDLPFDTKYEEDENLSEGEKKTKREGIVGSKEIKKTWKTLNGKRQGEPTVTENKLKDPVDKIVLVGVGGSKEEKEVVDTPYDTHYEDDNESLEGVRTRKQEGVTGSKEITRVWKTVKGVKKGEPKVTEKILKNSIDEIIKIGTLGYRFERLTNIIDPNYSFDYHDGTRYGKVTGTALGHHGLTETTKKYKTIKGVVTGEPEVSTKTLLEKLDTDKKLGTHGKNVYTETMIEPKGVTYVNDPILEEGKEVTAISGQDGLKERVSVWETYKGYRRGEAKVTENVIKERVDMVIRRGTKKKEIVQPKKEVVAPKVNEVNKGVENGVMDKVEEVNPIVVPKVDTPELKKEEPKVETPKPIFAFDSFFKEINEISDLISRLVFRNVNEEKRVSDMVETEKKVTTSNELLDLIKLFINK